MMIMKIYVVCYRASIVDLFSTFKNVLHCDWDLFDFEIKQNC